MNNGFENLVRDVESTRLWVIRQQGHSLIDSISEESYSQAMIDSIRVWLKTDLVDFINDYATCLSECIMALRNDGYIDETDIAAAEAISEIDSQLIFVRAHKHKQPNLKGKNNDPKWVFDTLGKLWDSARYSGDSKSG